MKLKKIYCLIFVLQFIIINSLSAQMYWNQAASFAGNSTSYISVPNSSSIDITGSFTLEAWINPSAPGIASRGIISKGGNLGTALRYAIRLSPTGKINLITNGAPRLVSKSSTVIPVNEWTHVSCTYNNITSLFCIYINGTLDSSSTFAAASPASNTDSLYIGISGSSTPFKGELDEVRIWNRDLSAAEVSKFMRTSVAVSGGNYSGLVQSITFQKKNSLSPFTFEDQSGNLNNGNGRNVTQVNQSFKPLHTISQNHAIEFDGTDDYIAAAPNTTLDVQSFTLECWLFPRSTHTFAYALKKGSSYELRVAGNLASVRINGSSYGLGTILPPNKWSHFTFSYDAATGSYFYALNGNSLAVGTGPSIAPSVTADSLYVGGDPGTAGSFFNGFVDELRITNRAKTRSEFKEYIHKTIDVANDPDLENLNLNYSFDGNLADNANEGGPEFTFRNGVDFSHPGQSYDKPESPVNRIADNSFTDGYYMRRPHLTLPSSGTFGSAFDSVKINYDETINDINLFVAVNHANLVDLTFVLISPGGDSAVAASNFSSNCFENNLITIFDDNADSILVSSKYCSFYSTIKPQNNFASVFNGKNSAGSWKLHVYDNESNNTGFLYAWGIQVNNQPVRAFNLNLTSLIQGFYNSNTNLMTPDTMTAIVRTDTSPYNIVGTSSVLVNSSGKGNFTFPGSGPLSESTLYYVQMSHRNTIESWSGGFIVFTDYEASPNFVTFIGTTFGNNAIQVDTSPVRFAFYGGDVNQDDFVDLSDITSVFNDANTFVSGYVNTDVTGDNFTDLSDLTLTFNNSNAFVGAITP